MKKITRFIFALLLIFLFLNGCGLNNAENNEDIFKYKGTEIGDNSAVINIIGQLQHSKEFQEVSLETKAKPYGMTLKYENINATMIEKEYKETAIYNATFLFALMENAEWITFHFDDHTYKITKSQLQDWYGKELNEYSDEEDLKSFVQEQMKDEKKLNQFFTK